VISEMAIINEFIGEIRAHRVKGWDSFEGVLGGQLYLIRHEHPCVWTWKVHGPSSSMPGFVRVAPVKWERVESDAK
jgi:hypothetical protein